MSRNLPRQSATLPLLLLSSFLFRPLSFVSGSNLKGKHDGRRGRRPARRPPPPPCSSPSRRAPSFIEEVGGGAVSASVSLDSLTETNSVYEQNFCKVAKLSFGLWGCDGGKDKDGASSRGGRREGEREASPIPAAEAREQARRREREGERERARYDRKSKMVVGARACSLFPPPLPPSLSIGRSSLLSSFLPSLLVHGTSEGADPSEERDGTKCIANRSIRLRQKGGRLSSAVYRRRGGRSAESPFAAAAAPSSNL